MSKKVKCSNFTCLRYVTEPGLCEKCKTRSFDERKPLKPVKKVSDKRRKENSEYSKKRAEFLRENPLCSVCSSEATDVHHKKGRIGSLLLNVLYWLAVCRKCHDKIEKNPEWAKSKGYSLSRLL